MFTIKIFAFFGLIYLIIGILNFKTKWTDELYFKNWDFEKPTRKKYIQLGILFILNEILFDLIINVFIYY